MGRSWIPEPPMENHSELTIPATVFLPDSDNEDQDIIQIEGIGENISENNGYQLLADNDNLDLEEDDDESNEEDSESVPNSETELTERNAQTNMCDNHTNIVDEDSDRNSKSNNDPPRDIVVDIEQVQAVMTHVTLPTSAIPTWAANVPDTEWGSFLQNRIALLQQRNSPSGESKP